ncbi:MAG TPA: AAA family ATPase [Longimicrobiales bacterium]
MTAPAMPFTSSREHLAAELAWLELVLQRRALEVAAHRGADERFDAFSGMYVTEQEIARYGAELERPASPLADERAHRLDRRIETMRQELDRRTAAAEAAGHELRLCRFGRRFGLSAAELRVLVCCLAPDWELRFQRYFAYLQNDVSKRRPTVQLLGELWFDPGAGAFGTRSVFSPEAPLVRERLLMLAGRDDAPFPARQPVVAEAVADYLGGVDRPDSIFAGFATLSVPRAEIPAAEYFDRHRKIVDSLLAPLRAEGRLPTAYVGGPPGCGKRRVVGALAAAAGVRLLRIDCRAWLGAGALTREALRTLRRDARLHGCLVELARCEALTGEAAAGACAALDEFLDEHASAGIVLTGTVPAAELTEHLATPLWIFEIPRPGLAERTELWHAALAERGWTPEPGLVDRLAAAFRFTPLEMRQALDGDPAALMNGAPGRIDGDALLRRCREGSRHAIHRFARKITPRRGWDDLVLPPDSRAQLEEICGAARSRRRVYEDWGFGRKLPLGAGLTVLFAGPSGVGKTMSAEILAGELGLDLFVVDLSGVVSKYIGETEKNLSRVFDEAETTNGVLCFDECDALFGKRTEIKDAHDRYANIEVSYLLQRIDQFDGVVILTTNLKTNLDAAFTRRLRYTVDFPFPEPDDRERIWRKAFPDEAPLSAEIDFPFLARQFKLSGGNIRNIALAAAFLAAGNGGRVGMEHVILATRRELEKMGKTCTKSDFGRYYSLLREGAAA